MTVSRETSRAPYSQPLASLAPLAAWLAKAAHPLGLTNYKHPDQLLQHALRPALALHDLLGRPPLGAWTEIGPGCGALGLTLALAAPGAHFQLIDRRQRVISFLDLTIARFHIPNARATLAPAVPDQTPAARPIGVCFRAIAPPAQALSLAAGHACHWICAWHTDTLLDYDVPPPGFDIAGRSRTSSPNLVATLYQRENGQEVLCITPWNMLATTPVEGTAHGSDAGNRQPEGRRGEDDHCRQPRSLRRP